MNFGFISVLHNDHFLCFDMPRREGSPAILILLQSLSFLENDKLSAEVLIPEGVCVGWGYSASESKGWLLG